MAALHFVPIRTLRCVTAIRKKHGQRKIIEDWLVIGLRGLAFARLNYACSFLAPPFCLAVGVFVRLDPLGSLRDRNQFCDARAGENIAWPHLRKRHVAAVVRVQRQAGEVEGHFA